MSTETETIPEPDEFLTPVEVAKVLGVSHSTVYKLLADGRIVHYRMAPKAVRIRRSDLIDYLVSIRRGPE